MIEQQSTLKIPGRHSRFVLDFAFDVQRKGYLGFFSDAWRRYGDLARFQIGPETMFLIVHPEHVKHISITNRQNYDKYGSYDIVRELLLGDGVLTSTGALWRRQRRLMAPFFTPRGIENYFDIMLAEGQAMSRRWEALADDGRPVEMIDEMLKITAAIILKTMFGSAMADNLLEMKDAVETMIQFVATKQMNPLQAPLWLPTAKNRRYHHARQVVHTYIDGIIAQRRAMPAADWPDDLLSKLMLARDEETGETMSDELLRDESITMFFAGHETTARTMTYLWYSLAQNPDVAARLHAEIDTVIGDGPVTLDGLKQLAYTLYTIKETLRLYPPAPTYVRDALDDDEIDGIPVPAGARMMIWPFLTHRHPDFWADPERFDPDRFQPEQEAARHTYAYHPFAAGQRICIGNNFSLFESQVLVALLARRFAPRLVPGYELQLEMAGTLVTKNGLPMIIARR